MTAKTDAFAQAVACDPAQPYQDRRAAMDYLSQSESHHVKRISGESAQLLTEKDYYGD